MYQNRTIVFEKTDFERMKKGETISIQQSDGSYLDFGYDRKHRSNGDSVVAGESNGIKKNISRKIMDLFTKNGQKLFSGEILSSMPEYPKQSIYTALNRMVQKKILKKLYDQSLIVVKRNG